MSKNKTIATALSVNDYLNTIDNPQRKEDCWAIHDLMKKVTGKEPRMWGTTIVGFGSYHYKYDSGREGDMLATGFSNRKQAITMYIMGGFKNHEELLSKVGPHKTGKSCQELEDYFSQGFPRSVFHFYRQLDNLFLPKTCHKV